MLRFCYASDRDYALRHYCVCGGRVGVWAIFCLLLETFLHFAQIFILCATALPDLRLLPSDLKPINPPLVHVCIIIVFGVAVTIPFAYYGIFNLIGGFVVPFTIAIIFEVFSFLYIGFLAAFHRTHLGLAPHLMLSIELFTALPIHVFCAFFFVHYLRFAATYQESLKLNVEFTHQVERCNYALKRQRTKHAPKAAPRPTGTFLRR
uniref:MARVEL domain-containing protein n=1 Tax=Panagrellus redivivus TaxID=6233 RepID=A0A7E4UQ73_PANRE